MTFALSCVILDVEKESEGQPMMPQYTYHVIADVVTDNCYTVKATSELEAIEKVKQGEFDEVEPLTSTLREILDVCLVGENE